MLNCWNWITPFDSWMLIQSQNEWIFVEIDRENLWMDVCWNWPGKPVNIGFLGQFQQKSIHFKVFPANFSKKSIHFNSWIIHFRFENECTLDQHSRVKKSYSISTVIHWSNKIIQIHQVARLIQFRKKPAARAGQPFNFTNGQTFSKCLHSNSNSMLRAHSLLPI